MLTQTVMGSAQSAAPTRSKGISDEHQAQVTELGPGPNLGPITFRDLTVMTTTRCNLEFSPTNPLHQIIHESNLKTKPSDGHPTYQP